MMILPGTLTDIQGVTNDTILFRFNTRSLENYGTLYINFTYGNPSDRYLVSLLNSKGTVIETKLADKPSQLTFRYILPGSYTLKATKDENQNGNWDTGKYLEHRQPEKVFYFPAEITVRSNWELTEEWVVE